MQYFKDCNLEFILDLLVDQTLEYSRMLKQRSKEGEFANCKEYIAELQEEIAFRDLTAIRPVTNN